MNKKKLKESIKNAGKSLWNSFPILIGVILLISMVNALIPASFYSTIFKNNNLLDSVIGSIIGSIFAGNPITSYVLGGEFLNQGINLIAITAFLVSWVTVGIVQLPAESIMLGKKFAILRNLSAFFLSIIVAIIVVNLVNLI